MYKLIKADLIQKINYFLKPFNHNFIVPNFESVLHFGSHGLT